MAWYRYSLDIRNIYPFDICVLTYLSQVDVLLRDLLQWDTLYLSGRLLKPVALIQAHDAIVAAMHTNCVSSLAAALLLLPPRFTETDLYVTIAGLSFSNPTAHIFPLFFMVYLYLPNFQVPW